VAGFCFSLVNGRAARRIRRFICQIFLGDGPYLTCPCCPGRPFKPRFITFWEEGRSGFFLKEFREKGAE